MDVKRRPRDTSKMSPDAPDFLKSVTSSRSTQSRHHTPSSSRMWLSPEPRGDRSRAPDGRSLRRQRTALADELRMLRAQLLQLEEAKQAAMVAHESDAQKLDDRIRALQEKSKAGQAKMEDRHAVEQATLRLYEDFMGDGGATSSPRKPEGSIITMLERIGAALQETLQDREKEKEHLQRTLLAIQKTQDAAAQKQQDTLESLRAEADAAIQQAAQDDGYVAAEQAAKLENLLATIGELEAERDQLGTAVGERERDWVEMRDASALREALLITKERHTVAYSNMEDELLDNRVTHASESVSLRQEASKMRDKMDKEAVVFFKIQSENTRMQQELRRLKQQVQASKVELGRSKVPLYEMKVKEAAKKFAAWEKEKQTLQRQLEELQQQQAEAAQVNRQRRDEYQHLAQAAEVDRKKRDELGDELFLTQSRVWQEADLPARHWKQMLQHREAEVEALSKKVKKSTAEVQRESEQQRLEVEALWEALQGAQPETQARPTGQLLRPSPPRDILRLSSPPTLSTATAPKGRDTVEVLLTPRSAVEELLRNNPCLQEVLDTDVPAMPTRGSTTDGVS